MCQMNRWPFSVALMGWVRKGICKKALLCEGWALSLRSWNSLSCVLGQAVFRSPPEENGGRWLDVDSSFSQTFLIQGNLVRTRGNVTDVPYPPPLFKEKGPHMKTTNRLQAEGVSPLPSSEPSDPASFHTDAWSR